MKVIDGHYEDWLRAELVDEGRCEDQVDAADDQVVGGEDLAPDHQEQVAPDLPHTDDGGWPVLEPVAFHGPAGAYALEADPFTEADRVGVLVSVLVPAGCAINRGPHMLAGNDQHPAAIFAALVGKTASAGKGTASAVGRAVMEVAAPDFMASRVMSGFGSGEAVVDAVRDGGEGDEGAPDTRLFQLEAEMARMLKNASREGSILSMTIRDGWDGRRLQVRSRAKTSVASRHHLGVVGHITVEELRARLTDVETYGGFSNRFIWVCVKRSKRLPSGGNVPPEIIEYHGQRIGAAIRAARSVQLVKRTGAAEARWADIYNELADDEPGGLLGAVIARSAPQVLRLSLLYALLDGSQVVDLEHVEAAHALWRYCRGSAAFIFGDVVGDEVADRLLFGLKGAGDRGLDFTAQSQLFSRHVPRARLDAARAYLEERGLAVTREEPTAGRPRMVTVAKEANQAKEGSR